MKKTIIALSLFFSIQGLFGLLFFFIFTHREIGRLTGIFIYQLCPYYFNGFDIYIPTSETGKTSFNVLTCYFLLTFLAGSILYVTSKFKQTRLLTFNYSLVLMISLVKMVYITANIKSAVSDLYSLLGFFAIIGYIVGSIMIIRYLNPKELNTYTEISGGAEVSYLEHASKSKRFLNYIIDSLFIIVVAFSLVRFTHGNNIIFDYLRFLSRIFGESFGGMAYFFTFKFFYYFIFESLFQATPAKLLTQCLVTDEEGKKLANKDIVIRTLCRSIPFESLLFLFGIRLHDTCTNSYVINQKKHGNQNKNYFIFLGSSFLLLVVIYFYDKI